MQLENIEAVISKCITDSVTLQKKEANVYKVNIPLFFGDGDSLKIILRQNQDGRFMLSDEAHTLMYLSYHNIEVNSSISRRKILDKILNSHDIEEDDGRLIMKDIIPEETGYAIFTFSQALLKIGDFVMWKREVIRNFFMEQFHEILPECTGGRKYVFDYQHKEIDYSGAYIVDCLIQTKNNNVHVYAVNSEIRAKDAALSMRFYSNQNLHIPSCAVFDEEARITKKSRVQITDAADKTIASLWKIPDMLPKFLDKIDRVA